MGKGDKGKQEFMTGYRPVVRAREGRMGASQVCYLRYMCNGTSVLFRGSGKVSKQKEGELLRTRGAGVDLRSYRCVGNKPIRREITEDGRLRDCVWMTEDKGCATFRI